MYNTIKIKDYLDSVNLGTIALPAYQRPQVW